MTDHNATDDEIQAHGEIKDGRARIDLDFGFGTLKLDVDQEALGDDDKIDILIKVLEGADTLIAQVMEALVGAADRG